MLIEQIKDHYLFESSSTKELAQINEVCTEVNFEEGQTIFEIDALPHFLFFVISGSVRLHLINDDHIDFSTGQMIGEIGILNGNFRLGKLIAIDDTKLIRLCGNELFKPEVVHPSYALSLVRKMGKSVTSYLRSNLQVSSREFIASGESSTVEFKSSLRWNYKIQKKDKVLESVVIKTIAGFLNTNGGHLFIGVNDKGEVLGLEHEGFENDDKLLLHLTSLIKQRISAVQLNFISMSIEKIDTKKLLRIDCIKTSEPAYVVDGNHEYFYIRTGPSTTALKLSDVYTYIKQNFKNH